jgi:hypothetical protein
VIAWLRTLASSIDAHDQPKKLVETRDNSKPIVTARRIELLARLDLVCWSKETTIESRADKSTRKRRGNGCHDRRDSAVPSYPQRDRRDS